MLTRNKVKQRIGRKTSPILTQTIAAALKEKSWMTLAKQLSSSTRQFAAINLSQIDALAKDNSVIVVPGKVLGTGALTKKVTVYALSFSESAISKMDKAKITHGNLLDIIQKNQKATGVQILV